MKKYTFIFLTFLFASTLYAQSWQRDYGIKNSYGGIEAIETYDKGLFIISTTSDLFGDNSLLIKTDVNGNILWQKYTDTILSVGDAVQCKDGSLILGGTVFSRGNNNSYPCIMKLNPCGETVWTSQIYDCCPSDGNLYYLYLKTNGDILAVCPNYKYYNNQFTSIIICLDSNGQYKWVYADGSQLERLHINKDGSILSAGCIYTFDNGDTTLYWLHTIASLIDSNGKKVWSDIYGQNIYKYGANGLGFNSPKNTYSSIHLNYDKGSVKEGNFYMIRYDSSGKREWVRYFGDTMRFEAFNDGIAINDSTYVLAGVSYDTIGKICLIKVNSEGKVLAAKNYYPPRRGYAMSIKPTYDGKFVVCNGVEVTHKDSVWVDSAHRFKVQVIHTYYYTHLIKVDENLNLDTFNNSLHFNYDSLCSKKITSGDTLFFPKKYNVIRVDTMHLYTGVEEPIAEFGIRNELKIYPNPSKENFTINIPQTPFNGGIASPDGEYYLRVFDYLGREIFRNNNLLNGENIIQTTGWSAGGYIIEVIPLVNISLPTLKGGMPPMHLHFIKQ